VSSSTKVHGIADDSPTRPSVPLRNPARLFGSKTTLPIPEDEVGRSLFDLSFPSSVPSLNITAAGITPSTSSFVSSACQDDMLQPQLDGLPAFPAYPVEQSPQKEATTGASAQGTSTVFVSASSTHNEPSEVASNEGFYLLQR